MLTKSQIKLISSLHHIKYRYSNQLFIAEGTKVVQELLKSNFKLHHLFTTKNNFENISPTKTSIISEDELKKISALSTPNNCLALFEIPLQENISEKGILLVLDNIKDPGNLGTILRLCDWFGIRQLICSRETVDLYNPKVIQATMGSIARVMVSYVDLDSFLKTTKIPVFGTFISGENIYKQSLPKEGIIIMGNESNGISKNLQKYIKHKISIPRFGNLQKTESLNVANATAIVLSEFFRNSN